MRVPSVCSVGLAALSVVAAVVPAARELQDPNAICDPEYQCEGAYYNWTDDGFPNNGVSIIFQICGLSNTVCVPTYTVPFNRATAIQFLDYDGVGNCTNTDGVQVPCTGNCEILGEGPPIFSVLDPIGDPFGGVSVTYFGVPSNSNDGFACPIDNRTGGPLDRTITINIQCDYDVEGPPYILGAQETSVCQYSVDMLSVYGCGCEPDCMGRNCGTDSCGGYCGGTGAKGACPLGQTCMPDYGVCCAPDCRGRQCGDDGCGGSCGTCQSGQGCTVYQQCAVLNASPTPSPQVQIVTIATTQDPADVAAGFFGGVFATAMAGVAFSLFTRIRYGRR